MRYFISDGTLHMTPKFFITKTYIEDLNSFYIFFSFSLLRNKNKKNMKYNLKK